MIATATGHLLLSVLIVQPPITGDNSSLGVPGTILTFEQSITLCGVPQENRFKDALFWGRNKNVWGYLDISLHNALSPRRNVPCGTCPFSLPTFWHLARSYQLRH